MIKPTLFNLIKSKGETKMSQTYPNYPSTSYPDSIDTFEKIVDVTLSTLPYAIMYQNYFEKGNLEEAYRILEEHPELEKCLMNADKFNKLIDAIKVIETDHNNTKSNLTTVTNQTSTNTSNISKLNTNVSNITTKQKTTENMLYTNPLAGYGIRSIINKTIRAIINVNQYLDFIKDSILFLYIENNTPKG